AAARAALGVAGLAGSSRLAAALRVAFPGQVAFAVGRFAVGGGVGVPGLVFALVRLAAAVGRVVRLRPRALAALPRRVAGAVLAARLRQEPIDQILLFLEELGQRVLAPGLRLRPPGLLGRGIELLGVGFLLLELRDVLLRRIAPRRLLRPRSLPRLVLRP